MVKGEGEAQSPSAYVDGVLGGATAKEAFDRYTGSTHVASPLDFFSLDFFALRCWL